MMDNIVIQLTGVKKIYSLKLEKPTLVENLIRGRRKSQMYVALDKVDLTIKRGEKVGIVGANGSGKTTLLKIISGISTPNSGRVQTQGRIVSLIDLAAGFHPELTGVENIYQNAMLLGMNRSETTSKLDEIMDFAGIGEFVNAPLYTYSSGMLLRLGFSVAVAADPDILILDEGVAVGDENFQKKSRDRLHEFYKKGKTVIMVSHWLDILKQNCARIIWMDGGSIRLDGGLEVINIYEKTNSKK